MHLLLPGRFHGRQLFCKSRGNGRWEVLPYFYCYKEFPQVFFGDNLLSTCNWDNVKGEKCVEEQVSNPCEGRAVPQLIGTQTPCVGSLSC